MRKIQRIVAVIGVASGAGLASMAGCAADVKPDPSETPERDLTRVDDPGDGELGTAQPALLASCGVANAECCGNCCHDGSECVYRAFQPNVCRKPPVPGSHTLSCNACNPIHLAGCAGALAACAAACAVTGPGCAACFASIGAAACYTCARH